MTDKAKTELGSPRSSRSHSTTGKARCGRNASCLPAWLWSPKGLKEAFTRLRAALLGRASDHPDAWGSFHIVRAQEDTGLMILASHEEELIDGE